MDRHEIEFTVLVGTTRLVRNLLASLIPPLIPILAVALEYPLWQLGLLVTIFTLGSGLGQAPFGYLSDKHDRRYILPTGISIAGGSYLLFGYAPQLESVLPTIPPVPFGSTFLVMCLSMLVCGVASSVVHPTVYPMITENVRASNKGKVLGIFGSAAKVGDATVPIVVGILLLVLVWEEIVIALGLVGAAFGALLFVLLSRFETEPREAMERPEPDETDVDEDKRTYAYPMVVIYLFFVTRGVAGRGVKTFVPAFVVGVYGYTLVVMGTTFTAESVANFYFSALLFVGAGTQIVVGWLVDRQDPRTVLVVLMLVATGGILGLAYLPLSPTLLLFVLLVVGMGIWGLNPARDMLISQITPADREGRTFGYLWTAAHLTGALIPTLVGYMADSFGLRQSFGVLSVGTLLAAGTIVLLYSDRVYVETSNDAARHQAVD